MVDHNEAFYNMSSNQLYEIFKSERCRVVTDSRIVAPGDIFFALKGDNFDGNRFADEALRKGARLAVVDAPEMQGERVLKVSDTLRELQSLAARHRESFDIPVMAITGSNGKTTTRELIAAVLSEKFRVHYTRGNLNNHIGVPLTIMSAESGTEFMLIEMGANHIGEIAALCNIAKPGYGIVTNIGRAHLEGFGSPEAVTEAKSELYLYLEKGGGIIFFNGENSQLSAIVGKLAAKAFTYQHPGRSYVFVAGQNPGQGLSLNIEIDNVKYILETALFGSHNIENILAAVACGLYFDISAEKIVKAISGYIPVNNRSQMMVTSSNRVICDSYNANPSSMEEALTSFLGQAGDRMTIILGDMLELGSYSDREHIKILDRLGMIPNADVYLVGPIFNRVANNKSFRLFRDIDDLNNYLSVYPIKDTFVLVKGSRGINLEKVYPLL